MKTKKKMLIVVGLVAVLIIAIGSWSWLQDARYESTDNAQLDGNIESVRASVTAYVESIRFTDNQVVHKGDTLIVFNAAALKAKVKQAEAALDNARANVSISDIKALASMENAKASLQTSLSNEQNVQAAKANLEKAQQDYKRVNELLKIKAATQEQLENAQNKLAVTKADYEQAISKQQSSLSTSHGMQTAAKAETRQISAAQALVKQREAELALAQEELNHAYVLAPFDGMVTKRSIQAQQYVSAGQTLCAVIDIQHLWVTANFKETQLNNIHPGQEVEIRVDAFPGVSWKGKVESFVGATGARFALLPPDNATGNFIKITQRFPVRIGFADFLNDPNKPTGLFPGLSAFVKIKIS
jgi:membrane fusion protein (multidrug efflux system)